MLRSSCRRSGRLFISDRNREDVLQNKEKRWGFKLPPPPSSYTDMSLHVRQKFNVSITSGLLPHPCDICD